MAGGIRSLLAFWVGGGLVEVAVTRKRPKYPAQFEYGVSTDSAEFAAPSLRFGGRGRVDNPKTQTLEYVVPYAYPVIRRQPPPVEIHIPVPVPEPAPVSGTGRFERPACSMSGKGKVDNSHPKLLREEDEVIPFLLMAA